MPVDIFLPINIYKIIITSIRILFKINLISGDKEYKIPNLTPLHLPQIDIISGENLKIKFKDVVLSGLESVDFKDVQ